MVLAPSAPPAAQMTLESGDRLTPQEFDRIYEDLHDVRAELINGVVYVSSPTRVDRHAKPLINLSGVCWTYGIARVGIDVFSDGSYYTEAGDRTQPDVCVYRTTFPASASVGEDGYLRGAPEFIAEVAASSASYDLHDKLMVYERAGVKEYLVWRVLEQAFSFFRLVDGKYTLLEPTNGIYESQEFPGLRFDTGALIAGNAQAALSALQ